MDRLRLFVIALGLVVVATALPADDLTGSDRTLPDYLAMAR